MDPIGTLLAIWVPVIAAAVLVSIALSALIYAVGSFLNNEQVKANARMGVVEAFYSIVILVLAGMLFSLANGVAEGVIDASHPAPNICSSPIFSSPAYQDLPCHLAFAKSFLNSLFAQGADHGFGMLRTNIWFSFISSIGISIDFKEHSMGSPSMSPFSGIFDMPSSTYSYMFDFTSKALMLTKFQEIFISFIGISLGPVLFVVGTVLRAFNLSRRLGGLLMAIAVSLYYVYPIFMVMGGIVFDSIAAAAPDNKVLSAMYVDMGPLYPPGYTSDGQMIGEAGFTDEQIASGEALQAYGGALESICQPTSDEDFDAATTEVSAWTDSLAEMDWWSFATGKTFSSIRGFLSPSGLTAGGSEATRDSLLIQGITGKRGIIDNTSRLVFFSFFFSFLSIMSTIAAIKGISGMLGGDIEIAGLTHLV